MICITVTPESRTLGKVDILNAAGRGDIVEVCLDRLIKEPDIKELLEVTNKPIIVSCRRKQDGGGWDGSEDERQEVLCPRAVSGLRGVEPVLRETGGGVDDRQAVCGNRASLDVQPMLLFR